MNVQGFASARTIDIRRGKSIMLAVWILHMPHCQLIIFIAKKHTSFVRLIYLESDTRKNRLNLEIACRFFSFLTHFFEATPMHLRLKCVPPFFSYRIKFFIPHFYIISMYKIYFMKFLIKIIYQIYF